jgi:hypothetical protein
MSTEIRLEREPGESSSDHSMKGTQSGRLGVIDENTGVDEHMKVFGHAVFCRFGANRPAEGFGA